jgi:hypothetical protein
MNNFRAVSILEGMEEGDLLEALAFLIRSGLVWQLQGSYGRAAKAAIEDGAISAKGEILRD